jgi:hypothetical protein
MGELGHGVEVYQEREVGGELKIISEIRSMIWLLSYMLDQLTLTTCL